MMVPVQHFSFTEKEYMNGNKERDRLKLFEISY